MQVVWEGSESVLVMGKKYFADRLANLKNNMLIELKYGFAGKNDYEKKILFIIIEGDVCIVLFWSDFAFPSEHITAWNEKSQYEHNISSDLKANLKNPDMVNFSTALFCFQPFFFFTKFSQILSTYYATQFIPFYQPLHFDSIKVNSVKNSILSVNFCSLLLKEGAQIFPCGWRVSVPSPSFSPSPLRSSTLKNWSRWDSHWPLPRHRWILFPHYSSLYSSLNKSHTPAEPCSVLSSLSSCFLELAEGNVKQTLKKPQNKSVLMITV